MPIRISDPQIRAFTDRLQSQPQPKIDGSNVLQLLAAAGDKAGTWGGWGAVKSETVLAQLQRPGISRKEQFDLANKGLTSTEKADFAQLLDQSGIQMEPGAKNFLAALVGREPLQETFGPLTITGNQAGGNISGIAKPGETVEYINLSTAPAGRLNLTDTIELGKADASGKFSGNVGDLKEGDLIRMRTRAADGSTSDWLTIQAAGTGQRDTRNAFANLERIDAGPAVNGEVPFTANTTRPISEPGATLRFTNVRTGEKTDVKVGDDGLIPKDLKLKGQAGDTFNVAASDGKNNVDFRESSGTLKVPGSTTGPGGVDLPDPKPLAKNRNADGTSALNVTRFTGPLFIDGPKLEDVRQGAIGDCYFPAAMASLAFHSPEVIQNMIKDNGNGTYTVTFKPNGRTKEITVDADLYARSYGGPVYGSSLGGSTAPDKMELWFPLVEKAYAQLKGGTDGGYETIGNGGVAGQVMADVTGRSYDYENISEYNMEAIFDRIKAGGENNTPMAAGTYGTDESARYTNTGVYANHAYTVMGGEVGADGKKYVLLRNPWGQSEGGNDGVNDGKFKLPLEDFAKLYRAVHILE